VTKDDKGGYHGMLQLLRKDRQDEQSSGATHGASLVLLRGRIRAARHAIWRQAFESSRRGPESAGYRHARRHNIYFKDHIRGLAADHPVLKQFETVNYTLCADQLAGTVVDRIYEWTPLAAFLALVLNKPRLFLMNDPLAKVNVMAYGPGEALNWHFDRSQFTTTLLIRAAESGGEFEYRSGLRSDTEPNYDGVARLLRGEDPKVSMMSLAAGTLNVFAGKNTAHRVTSVRGTRSRIVAVFSYYDNPGVTFSSAERIGFYGRAA
jgi:hypothetical protein